MAIPRPALDKMWTELYNISGIWKCHLHVKQKNKWVRICNHNQKPWKIWELSFAKDKAPEGDKRPDNSNKTGVGIRVANKLPKCHDWDELHHHNGGGHCFVDLFLWKFRSEFCCWWGAQLVQPRTIFLYYILHLEALPVAKAEVFTWIVIIGMCCPWFWQTFQKPPQADIGIPNQISRLKFWVSTQR